MAAGATKWLAAQLVNLVDQSSFGGNSQSQSRIIHLANGNILVVWTSDADPVSGPGSSYGTDILGRIYDPFGIALTDEILLNTTFNGDDEQLPDITPLSTGGFVMSYLDLDQTGGTEYDLRAITFDNSGVAQQHTVLFDDTTDTDSYGAPVIAGRSSSVNAAAYTHTDTLGVTDVVLQLFNPGDGTPVGPGSGAPIVVFDGATYNSDGIGGLDVAVGAGSRGWYVAFAETRDPGDGNDRVHVARYDTYGGFAGRLVIGDADADAVDPRILTFASNGNYVVSWTADSSGGTNSAIRLRIYTEAGNHWSDTINPLSTKAGIQSHSALAALPNDSGFMIAWIDEHTHAVRAQCMDMSGAPIGDEFVIVKYSTGATITDLDLETMRDGRIAASWSADAAGDGNSDVYMAIRDPRSEPNPQGAYDDGIVVGTPGDDTLVSGVGENHLYGFKGDDTFLVDAAHIGTRIFDGGQSAGDQIVLTGLGTFSFNAATVAHMEKLVVDETETGARTMHFLSSQFSQFTEIDFARGKANADSLEIWMDSARASLKSVTLSDYSTTRDHVTFHGSSFVDGLMEGFRGDDTFYADTGSNEMRGYSGNDLFHAGPGGNYYDGGFGIDTLSYATATSGIVVDLYLHTASGYAAGDGFSSIEKLIGTDFDDSITMRDGSETVSGGAGDDYVMSGGGDDLVYCGAGNDQVDAGDGNDEVHGGGGRDLLKGWAGNDRIFGEYGNDRMFGGGGDDTLTGGAGSDEFVYWLNRIGFGNDVITDFDATDDNEVIDLNAVKTITSFDDLRLHHMSQSGDDVVIDAGNGNTITLLQVDIADLDMRDFIF